MSSLTDKIIGWIKSKFKSAEVDQVYSAKF